MMATNDDTSDSDIFSSANSTPHELEGSSAYDVVQKVSALLADLESAPGILPKSTLLDATALLTLLQRFGRLGSCTALMLWIYNYLSLPPIANVVSFGWWTSTPAPGQPSMMLIILVDGILASFSYSLLRTREFLLCFGLAIVATQVSGGGMQDAFFLTCLRVLVSKASSYLPSEQAASPAGPSANETWLGLIQHVLTLQVVALTCMLATRQFALSYSADQAPPASQTTAKRETEAAAGQTAKKRKQPGSTWAQPLWEKLASMLVSWHIHDFEIDNNNRAQQSLASSDRFYIASLDSAEVTLAWFPRLPKEMDASVIQSRVNGILWAQSSLQQASDDCTIQGIPRQPVWFLLLYGLTPATEYDVEVYNTQRGEGMFRAQICTSVRTVDDDREVVGPRPVSPTTFLRDTLVTAREVLHDSRQRLKRAKRDHSKHLTSQRTEIDFIRSRVGNGDKVDERIYRRVLYLRGYIKRAEEESESMCKEQEALEDALEASEEEWRLKKAEWEAMEVRLREAEHAALRHRESCERRMARVQAKKSTHLTRRERVQARKAKMVAELEALIEERDQVGQEQRQEARQKRQELASRRKRIEDEFSVNIGKMERAIVDRQQRTLATRQAIDAQRSLAHDDLRRSSSSNVHIS